MALVNRVELRTSALAYAAMGWPVFPVGEDKQPLTAHGFKAASRESRLIYEWWRRHPDAGIGLAIPEGLLVLDVDPRNGGVRPEGLPDTKESATRSGGQHLYFSVPPDLAFRGQLQQGVDVKAPGKGYVILPPTPGYTWTRRGPAVDLPGDVLKSLARVPVFRGRETDGRTHFLPWEDSTRYGAVALANQVETVMAAGEGARNLTLYKATCAISRLIAGGELREEPALKTLFDAAVKAGLGDHEVLQTMESAYAAGIEEPRSAPRG